MQEDEKVFLSHTNTLMEMKQDLGNIFYRIKMLQGKLARWAPRGLQPCPRGILPGRWQWRPHPIQLHGHHCHLEMEHRLLWHQSRHHLILPWPWLWGPVPPPPWLYCHQLTQPDRWQVDDGKLPLFSDVPKGHRLLQMSEVATGNPVSRWSVLPPYSAIRVTLGDKAHS